MIQKHFRSGTADVERDKPHAQQFWERWKTVARYATIQPAAPHYARSVRLAPPPGAIQKHTTHILLYY
eukprot:7956556-Pyramimonas_sp.AAC.1